jgi:choline dehydrogenase-like flavoprotein
LWFRAPGAIDVVKGQPFGPALSKHTYGRTRMGDHPETNVVDQWGFSHEASNLGMLGGSVFVSIGMRNPTLTIRALAGGGPPSVWRKNQGMRSRVSARRLTYRLAR